MTLLAHKDADGGVQTLRDHLHNAGDLAESYESEFSQIPRMAALLHDVGKVAQQFQTYLISNRGYMIWTSTCKTPSSRPKKMFSIL